VLKLRSEVEARLQSAIASLDDKALTFKHEISNLSSDLNASLEKRTIQLADDFATRLDSHRRAIDESLHNILSKLLPDLEARLQQRMAEDRVQMKKDFESESARVKSDLYFTRWELYDNIGEQCQESEAWTAAVIHHTEALEVAVDMQIEWFVSQSLTNIEKCLTAGAQVTELIKRTFVKVKDRIPGKLSNQFEQVDSAVQKAAIFKSP
jgi:dGTP triphosphohydrolase